MIKTFFGMILCAAVLLSCSTRHAFQYETDPHVKQLLQTAHHYPDTRFIVFSDPHFYDKLLGSTGTAFQKYIAGDRKLLGLSREILWAAIENISNETADFVIVPGDLTKDGERINHQGVITALKKLESSGKKVYVVPGNHDIDNGAAVQYMGDKTLPVPGITAKEFKTLYHEFGYKEAIAEDPYSLSYVAEPEKGLWILALDSCKWKENTPGHHPVTGGSLSRQTLEWVESQLVLAKKQQKAVIALLHHGIMEHYPANEKYYGAYVIDDHETVSSLLAAYGVGLVFTGHFHAQDITKKEFKNPDGFIFDIETGSLVTAPCPYRRVQIQEGYTATINSRFITSIPSMPDNFAEYARQYIFNGTITMANAKLDKFRVSKQQQPLISSQASAAYCAHLSGDEKKPAIPLNTDGFGWWLGVVAWMQQDLIDGWWTDLLPEDNDLTIDLRTGDYF